MLSANGVIRAYGRALFAYLLRFPPVHLLAVAVLMVTSFGVLMASSEASPLPTAGRTLPPVDWAPGVVALVGQEYVAEATQSVDGLVGGGVPGSGSGGGSATESLEDQWRRLAPLLPPGAQGTAIRGGQGSERYLLPTGPVLLYPAEVDFADPHLDRLLVLTEGELPKRPGEVVVSEHTAETYHLTPGTILPAPLVKQRSKLMQQYPHRTVTGIVRQRFPSTVQGKGASFWMFGQSGTLIAREGTAPSEASVSWAVAASTPIGWADVVAVNAKGFTVQSKAVIAHPPTCVQLAPKYRHPELDFGDLGLFLDPCAKQASSGGFWKALPKLGPDVALLLAMTVIFGSALLAPTNRRRQEWLEERIATAAQDGPRVRVGVLVALAAMALALAGALIVVAWLLIETVYARRSGAYETSALDTLWRPVILIGQVVVMALLAAWPADVLARARFSPPLALRWVFAVAALAPLAAVWHLLNVDTDSWGRLVPLKILIWTGLATSLLVLALVARRYPSAVQWRRAWLPIVTTVVPLVVGLAGPGWAVMHRLAPELTGQPGATMMDEVGSLFGCIAWGLALVSGLILLVIHREHVFRVKSAESTA